MASARRVIKQYGAKRTGTNLVRHLVTASFPDALVLMHILGDKHAIPAPQLMGAAPTTPREAADMVRDATTAVRAESTVLEQAQQAAHLDAVIDVVAAALREQTLGVVISTRDPRAWMMSMLLGERDSPWPVRAHARATTLYEWARVHCRRFNAQHAAWSALLDLWPDRCQVVRLEDLIAGPAVPLGRIAAQLALAPADAGLAGLPRGRLRPADWDDAAATEQRYPFEPRPLSAEELELALPAAVREAIVGALDWRLMSRFRYTPPAPRAHAARRRPDRPLEPSRQCGS